MTWGRRLPPRLVTRALLTSCLIFVAVLAFSAFDSTAFQIAAVQRIKAS